MRTSPRATVRASVRTDASGRPNVPVSIKTGRPSCAITGPALATATDATS